MKKQKVKKMSMVELMVDIGDAQLKRLAIEKKKKRVFDEVDEG